jgi:drug/metabolite transporter (DMT)-like permease
LTNDSTTAGGPVAGKASTSVGLGTALLSAATFGTSGSFARSLTDAGWSPAAAVLARVTVAAVVLAVPAVLALRGRWWALRRNASFVSLFGLLAVASCQVFFFNAIERLSVGVALLLEYMGVVLVVAWLWARHGNRPRRLTVVGSVVALAGLALVLDIVGGAHLDPIGVLWGLAAATGLAGYYLMSSKEDPDLPPIAVASGGMVVGAVALAACGAARVLPMHAGFGSVQFAGHRTSWVVPVLGLSIVAAAIAYVAGITAARALGAKLSSFVGLTEVIFAVLTAWALLGELPTLTQLLGGALIVAGVTLVRLDELRPVPVTAAEAPLAEVA